MPKVKFEVVTKKGTQPWSGFFKDDKQADDWMRRNGSFWKSRGRTFVKVYER